MYFCFMNIINCVDISWKYSFIDDFKYTLQQYVVLKNYYYSDYLLME